MELLEKESPDKQEQALSSGAAEVYKEAQKIIDLENSKATRKTLVFNLNNLKEASLDEHRRKTLVGET